MIRFVFIDLMTQSIRNSAFGKGRFIHRISFLIKNTRSPVPFPNSTPFSIESRRNVLIPILPHSPSSLSSTSPSIISGESIFPSWV